MKSLQGMDYSDSKESIYGALTKGIKLLSTMDHIDALKAAGITVDGSLNIIMPYIWHSTWNCLVVKAYFGEKQS